MSFLRTLLLSTLCLFVAPLHAQSLDSLTGTPPAAEGEAAGVVARRADPASAPANRNQQQARRGTQGPAGAGPEGDHRGPARAGQASPDEDAAERYAKQSVEALEQRLSARVEELSEWQKQFSAANSMIITAQTRPERAQAQIGTAQTRIQEINNLLKNGRESGKPLSEERRALLDAEIVSLNAQIELRRRACRQQPAAGPGQGTP